MSEDTAFTLDEESMPRLVPAPDWDSAEGCCLSLPVAGRKIPQSQSSASDVLDQSDSDRTGIWSVFFFSKTHLFPKKYTHAWGRGTGGGVSVALVRSLKDGQHWQLRASLKIPTKTLEDLPKNDELQMNFNFEPLTTVLGTCTLTAIAFAGC